MSLGERLRERRLKLRLTNGQVAKYIGISKAHVSDMEHDRSKPSLELLGRLARYYKTTTDYLLELTDQAKLPEKSADIEQSYNEQDSMGIVAGLSEEYRLIVTRLAVALRDLETDQRERALGKFIMRMMGDFEDRFGEGAAEELTDALDLFTDTGDDSALRAWFARYLGGEDLLPD